MAGGGLATGISGFAGLGLLVLTVRVTFGIMKGELDPGKKREMPPAKIELLSSLKFIPGLTDLLKAQGYSI